MGTARRSGIWLLIVAAVGIIALVGEVVYYGVRKANAPKPPEITLRGEDRLVDEALVNARQLVLDGPYMAEAWGHFGKVLLAHEYRKEAAIAFAKAAELNPAEPRWPYFEATALELEQYDAVAPLLQRTVDLLGTSSPNLAPRMRLAEALLERGQLDQAEAQLKFVLERDPGEPRALLAMGQLAIARGQNAEARRDLERSRNYAPRVKRTHVLLASVYGRLGEKALADQANVRAQELPERFSWGDDLAAEVDDVRTGRTAWLDQADLLTSLGRTTDSINLLRKTVNTYPDSARGWLSLGMVLQMENRLAESEFALRKAIELDPKRVEPYGVLGYAQLKRGAIKEAETNARKSIELQPTYADGYMTLGMSLLQQNRTAEAIVALRSAVQHRPSMASGHVALADALSRIGQIQEAMLSLRRAVELEPNNPSVRNTAAVIQARAQQPATAPAASW
jgi:tetratricopeptide (TPR) repeat protein